MWQFSRFMWYETPHGVSAILSCLVIYFSFILSEVFSRGTEECGVGCFVYSVLLSCTVSSRLARELHC